MTLGRAKFRDLPTRKSVQRQPDGTMWFMESQESMGVDLETPCPGTLDLLLRLGGNASIFLFERASHRAALLFDLRYSVPMHQPALDFPVVKIKIPISILKGYLRTEMSQ